VKEVELFMKINKTTSSSNILHNYYSNHFSKQVVESVY